MLVKYLGTGAAEGIPAVFCKCNICQNARTQQGKEIRTRSQALIDNCILIDFGPDTYAHSLSYQIDLSSINHCLITHAHDDHLYREDICARRRSRANLPHGTPPLTVYGGKGVMNTLSPENNGAVTKDQSVLFQKLEPYRTIILCDKYTIVALPAVHGSEEPFVYAITKSDRTFLYGHDTDIFDEEVWEYLRAERFRFDAVSLDCTEGNKDILYRGHMNFHRLIKMRKRLMQEKLAREGTKFIANHISHNGLITHEEAVRIAEKIGFIVAHDGMELIV